jgi:integrase
MERENLGPCDRQGVAAVRLLLFTGARAGEVLGLRWEHVDEERGVLRLPDSKTGAKEILLGPAARAVLADLRAWQGAAREAHEAREESGYVIPGRVAGAPLVNLHKVWKRCLRLAELDKELRLHDLRRTAASAGASAGLALETVGQLLGHQQADTTKRYAYLFEDARREAAERLERQLSEALAARPKVVPLKLKR